MCHLKGRNTLYTRPPVISTKAHVESYADKSVALGAGDHLSYLLICNNPDFCSSCKPSIKSHLFSGTFIRN